MSSLARHISCLWYKLWKVILINGVQLEVCLGEVKHFDVVSAKIKVLFSCDGEVEHILVNNATKIHVNSCCLSPQGVSPSWADQSRSHPRLVLRRQLQRIWASVVSRRRSLIVGNKHFQQKCVSDPRLDFSVFLYNSYCTTLPT
jgi:hypothetical protein